MGVVVVVVVVYGEEEDWLVGHGIDLYSIEIEHKTCHLPCNTSCTSCVIPLLPWLVVYLVMIPEQIPSHGCC